MSTDGHRSNLPLLVRRRAGYDATPALLTSVLSAKNCSWLYNLNVTCGPICSQIGRYFACQWGQQAAEFSMNGDLSFVISLNSRCTPHMPAPAASSSGMCLMVRCVTAPSS